MKLSTLVFFINCVCLYFSAALTGQEATNVNEKSISVTKADQQTEAVLSNNNFSEPTQEAKQQSNSQAIGKSTVETNSSTLKSTSSDETLDDSKSTATSTNSTSSASPKDTSKTLSKKETDETIGSDTFQSTTKSKTKATATKTSIETQTFEDLGTASSVSESVSSNPSSSKEILETNVVKRPIATVSKSFVIFPSYLWSSILSLFTLALM